VLDTVIQDAQTRSANASISTAELAVVDKAYAAQQEQMLTLVDSLSRMVNKNQVDSIRTDIKQGFRAYRKALKNLAEANAAK